MSVVTTRRLDCDENARVLKQLLAKLYEFFAFFLLILPEPVRSHEKCMKKCYAIASFSLGIRKNESKNHVENCATECIFLKSHTMSCRFLYMPAKNDDDADYFLWSWSQRIRKQR